MRAVVAALMILATSAPAAEVAWLKLSPIFSYKDLQLICSTSAHTPFLYLGMELEGDRIIRASLRTDLSTVLTEAIAFQDPLEKDGVQLYRDPVGRPWLREWSIPSRIVEWIFFHVATALDECKPEGPIGSITPIPALFHFATGDLGQGTLISRSDRVKFSGRLKDNSFFQASLDWVQEQVPQ